MESTNSKKKDSAKTEEEYYTKEEIKRLDKIHEKTNYKFDDDEVYQLMQKYKNDDDAIIKDLQERRQNFQREYIGKSNYKFLIYLFNRRKSNKRKVRRKKEFQKKIL